MKAAFFGGAKRDTETPEYLDSIKIGEILAKKGYIVKNGGYYGLMEAVSIGNEKAIGYTCTSFGSARGNSYLSETIVCDDIYDRLRGLIEGTDLFIVQRGGIGTLAELFLTLDCVRKLKEKPLIILVGEFWEDVINGFSKMISEKEMKLITIIKSIEELNGII